MPTYLVWRWMVLLWQIIMPWLKWVSRESGHERVLHVLHAHFKPETYASSYQVTVTCTQPVQFFTVRALSRVLNHTKSEKRSVSFVSRSRTMSPPKEIWKLGEKIQLGIHILAVLPTGRANFKVYQPLARHRPNLSPSMSQRKICCTRYSCSGK